MFIYIDTCINILCGLANIDGAKHIKNPFLEDEDSIKLLNDNIYSSLLKIIISQRINLGAGICRHMISLIMTHFPLTDDLLEAKDVIICLNNIYYFKFNLIIYFYMQVHELFIKLVENNSLFGNDDVKISDISQVIYILANIANIDYKDNIDDIQFWNQQNISYRNLIQTQAIFKRIITPSSSPIPILILNDAISALPPQTKQIIANVI
jgi:hypothetical protein